MAPVLVGYLIVLLATTVVTVALASYAWTHDQSPAARPLVVVLLGQAVWCGATFAGGVARGTRWALPLANLWYVGVVLVVAGLFCFSLAFTGRTEYLTPKSYALLSVEPVLLGVVVLTNYRGLHYRAVYESEAAIVGLGFDYGAGFWVHTVYSYVLLGVATVLLLRFALGSKATHRKQAYAVIVGAAVPWVASTAYLLTETAFDPTPLAFSVTGAACWWAVFRGRLLALEPIANREVVSSLNSAVFVVDVDGRLVKRNDAAAELLGDRAVAGADADAVLSAWPDLYDAFRPGEVTEQEHRAEVEQGGRYFDVLASPLYDDRDQLVGQVYLVHEITERKRRERELQRRNSQLDQFASVVSHDLRNPLSVASGSLDLAEQTGDGAHFERVRRAHERMDDLIDQVLALSRDEGSLETAPHPLADIARRAWTHVDTAEATLTVETDDALVCDEDQLLQLFENAFRNSVDHAGPDCHVTVTTVREGDPPAPASDSVLIADDGPGIPEDQRDAVFDHGMTTSDDGTGLGLAIIEKIARSHGWSVRATDGPEGGLGLVVSGVTLQTPATEMRQ